MPVCLGTSLPLFARLGRFFAFLGRSGLDFGGFWGVRGWFWRLPSLIFRGFLLRLRMRCEKRATSVSYCKNKYETHVGNPVRDVNNSDKSIWELCEWSFPCRSRKRCVRRLPGVDFGGFRELPGRLLGASWVLLGASWTLLATSWALLGRLLVALGRRLAGLGCLLGASCLSGRLRAGF